MKIKAVDAIIPEHQAQVRHYLKATNLLLGLILNFGASKIQIKRLIV